jgi:hypothetical protein
VALVQRGRTSSGRFGKVVASRDGRVDELRPHIDLRAGEQWDRPAGSCSTDGDHLFGPELSHITCSRRAKEGAFRGYPLPQPDELVSRLP